MRQLYSQMSYKFVNNNGCIRSLLMFVVLETGKLFSELYFARVKANVDRH